MTLDEIKAENAELIPVDPNAPNGDTARPWWVVVVNPRRQPPEPKFHSGHVSQVSAEATCVVKQAEADLQAAEETVRRSKKGTPVQAWTPYRYYAIERPA